MGDFQNCLKYLVRLTSKVPLSRVSAFLEWSQIRDVLIRQEINCVLDVGANDGQYARSLRAIGYQGQIFSFEPIPRVFQQLEANMESDPKWEGHCYALGKSDQEQILHVAIDSTPMSSFLRHKDGKARMQDIKVSVKRLDSIFDELLSGMQNPRIFLKLDTQGYDLEVVEGAGYRTREIACLQSELSVQPIYDDMPGYLTAMKRYEELGFHLADIFEISRDSLRKTIVELNCIMIYNP